MSGRAIILCATPAADSQLRSRVASCYADSRAKAELRHRELHSLSRDPVSARQGFVLWDAMLQEGCEQQQKSRCGAAARGRCTFLMGRLQASKGCTPWAHQQSKHVFWFASRVRESTLFPFSSSYFSLQIAKVGHIYTITM